VVCAGHDSDSCNHWACLSMIEVLNPKWDGSEEEMLKFARDMAEKGNWAGTIPDMVHNVHWQIAAQEDAE